MYLHNPNVLPRYFRLDCLYYVYKESIVIIKEIFVKFSMKISVQRSSDPKMWVMPVHSRHFV